ncbi:MAG: 4-hydroxy-tetrahydrodipicolinate synthase [Oscillospiraceae bacterium]|nr:4-hydroxy-tetrahydrodipicolinate synthase [Oscillospiraceae bacterium]
MKKDPIFTGAAVAITTPFHLDGSVDFDGLGKNIDYQIDNGTDAIVICGTTGESSTMSDEEHRECIRYAVERTNHRVPVIAGTGSNDTRYAIELSVEAQNLGADGLLLVTPYYNKTTQAGLIDHFTIIANSVNIPIILYNIPGRTGMNIAVETLEKLAHHKNIAAVKEASGNISYTAQVAAACGHLIDIYSGNDDMIVPIMSLGGKGVISVLSNILPKETHEICQLCLDNDFKAAGELQIKYLELINALFCEVNPIPVKEAMNQLGMPAGACRMPLTKMGAENVARLLAAMQRLGMPVPAVD